MRLSKDIKNFLNWNMCERTFLINGLIALIIIPTMLVTFNRYPNMVSYVLAICGILICLTSYNLYEIHKKQESSKTIYPQIVFIAFVAGFGASVMGSVSSGIGTFAIFLTICYYLVAGIHYALFLGILTTFFLVSIINLDFVFEMLPYYWARDLANINHSGNEVRTLLGLTKPGKVAMELLFISGIPLTLLVLRSFDRQMRQKSKALEETHEMLQDSKYLSDNLLSESQKSKHALEENITELLEAVQQVGEGNLIIEIPDFGEQAMGRLAKGFKGMVEELHKARHLDEQLRAKEQEQQRVLRECINQLLDVVEEVGKGNLEVTPADFEDMELSRLSKGLAEMITKQSNSREEELRQQREIARTSALVENAPNSLIFIDADGIIRYMNPMAQQLFRSLHSFLAVPVSKIVGSSYEVLCPHLGLRQALLYPKHLPYQCEIEFGVEWVNVKANAVNDAQGNFMGPMLSYEIITEEKARKERDRQLQKKAKSISSELASASHDLLIGSEQMAEASSKTSQQTQVVVVEANEIQKSMEHIATTLEEMVKTLVDNENMVNTNTRMSAQAVEFSRKASEIITTLGKGSLSIGVIVQFIHRITSQTNILALNATIQATRAGEAGKGFGVVAREVKALAQQTSQATKEISARIKAIQEDAKKAVESIEKVNDVIKEMNQISGYMSIAIEEQTIKTHEISMQMEEAFKATQMVVSNIHEVAEIADIAKNGVQKGREAIVRLDNIAINSDELINAF
ncbi:methyl-accepting chemotaxis protein [Deltaproteobacteria bacterium TL4]